MAYFKSEKHYENIAKACEIAAQTKEKCRFCYEDFVKANISKHEVACYDNPTNLTFCLVCQTRIKHTSKFCSRSCAAKHNNVKIRSNTSLSETFQCLACSKERSKKKGTKNLYCSNVCQQQYMWETVTRPSILRGERSTHTVLRRFLLERDGPSCSICSIENWLGEPITMDVDHIDGDHRNNSPENFRLICPNCHRQTPTWGKKNPLRYGATSLRHTPK